MNPPVALTIAGTDSGGGAGIAADLATFSALGVFGTLAVAAVTAQNTLEVRRVDPVPPSMVVAQIEAVIDDLPVQAAKAGMLAQAATVRAVAEMAAAGRLTLLVVDPVLVSSTGHRLCRDDALVAYREALFPRATLITPNLAEASVLLERPVTTLVDQREAARRLGELAPHVVVKGGHPVVDRPDLAVDVYWDGAELVELTRPRVDTLANHGSGCTFAAAVTAGLASGHPLALAVELANAYVHRALRGAAGWRLGGGHGPLDHFGWGDAPRPLPPFRELGAEPVPAEGFDRLDPRVPHTEHIPERNDE